MKTDTLPAEVKSYVDYAVAAAYAQAQRAQSILANHAFAANSANVSIGNTATPIVTISNLVQRGTGRYRIYGMANFTNPGAVTHTVQLQIFAGVGSSAATAIFSGTSVQLISGGDAGFAALQYEMPLIAGNLQGSSSSIILEGAGDISCSCSVLANGASLVVQEMF